ncbi:MAG: hypothetical protein M3328_10225, partial [Chloroflexota bacterium]|nr:hypothetical protein [Chloroflexota bacterium]
MRSEAGLPDATIPAEKRITAAPSPDVREGSVPRARDSQEHGPNVEPARTNWRGVVVRLLTGLLTISSLVLVWWLLAVVGNYPAFILPTPAAVGERMWSMLLDGSLFAHFRTTSTEAGLGFLLALTIGLLLGYPIGHSRLLERVLSPYIAVSQGLPVVA